MSIKLKIPTVSNFLFYFDLSTAGLMIGIVDVVFFGVTLLTLVINVLTGMKIIDSDKLNNFTVLGLLIKCLLSD